MLNLSLRDTIADCTSCEAMEYIGASTMGPEAKEVLEFHSRLLTSHLGALVEVSSYHESYPWRLVLACDVQYHEKLMKDMALVWTFTNEFVDGLYVKDVLYHWFSFTRYQPFRDCMIKAESPSVDSLYFHFAPKPFLGSLQDIRLLRYKF